MTIVFIETAIAMKCSFITETFQKKSGFCFNAPSANLQNWTFSLQSFSLNSCIRL